MKKFKIKAANRKEAYDVQQAMFKLGCAWAGGEGHTVQYPEALTFFVYDNGMILHNYSDFDYFDRHDNPEVSLESLQYMIVKKDFVQEEFQEISQPTEDAVNNPKHYTSHPSGIECIDVTRHMSFNLGNATKYIWRCDLKKDAIEDLRKAIFYLNDEINLRLSKKEC